MEPDVQLVSLLQYYQQQTILCPPMIYLTFLSEQKIDRMEDFCLGGYVANAEDARPTRILFGTIRVTTNVGGMWLRL